MAGVTITIGGNFAFLNQLQAKVGETAAKIRNGFAERIGHRMFDGLLSAAAQVPEMMSKAIDAASDMGETLSKTGVVFGEQTEKMLEWSKASATAFGQSRAEALGAASDFGNLFSAMGIGETQSASMSRRLVELAADLASFNNTNVPEAIQAIGAALRGEAEPIRRYGVLLDEATLKAQAMADGLSDGKGSLDPSTRALAAYNVILSKTGTAQGDFARTSDGLANSQRILSANFSDAMVQLGEGLLPLVQELASSLKEIDFATVGDAIGKGIMEATDMVAKSMSSFERILNPMKLFGGRYAGVSGELTLLRENAMQAKATNAGNALVTEFSAYNVEQEVASPEEVAKKLVALEAAKVAIADMVSEMKGRTDSPSVQFALENDVEATIKILDIQAKKIKEITAEQLAANKAKRDAAEAEKAHAREIVEAGKAYEKAKKDHATALEKVDKARFDAKPVGDRVALLNDEEAELWGKKLLADKAETLKIETRLLEIGAQRAGLLEEQAKAESDAYDARQKAVADYDTELAMIRAKIDGSDAMVAKLEREAAVRAKIAELAAAGMDPGEAAGRAEAIIAANEQLKIAEKRRENEKAIAAGRNIVAGKPADRIDSNEAFLDRLKDLRGQYDGATYRSGMSKADSLQSIGGGGGVYGINATIDYQRTQTELLREMNRTLIRLEDQAGKPDPN
jgi:hypothetical protein